MTGADMCSIIAWVKKRWWDLQEKVPHHTTMSEVAIHISNHTVHQGDRGLVVVGAASHYGDLSTQNRARTFPGAWSYLTNPTVLTTSSYAHCHNC
jgi:hypothetical protein